MSLLYDTDALHKALQPLHGQVSADHVVVDILGSDDYDYPRNILDHTHYPYRNNCGSNQLPQDPTMHPLYVCDPVLKKMPLHHANLAYTYHDRQSVNPPVLVPQASSMLLGQ